MRERRIPRLAAALVVVCEFASASVVGYHVEPVKALWSGLTRTIWGQDYVEQQVVACWDSLERIELFAGAKGNGGTYHVTVYDGGTPLMSSDGDWVPDQGWVRFEDWNTQVAFTKGKIIRLTPGGSDSRA
jgi:hypothetical protein